MPGPSPKPTALRLLQGNPSHRPINRDEVFPSADSGYCPKHLTRLARAEWRRVVPELKRVGLFTIVDRAALEAYCECYATWRQAQDGLAEHGLTCETEKGFPMQRPEVAIANNALKQLRTFMGEFGMTPSSRTRVRGIGVKPQPSRFEKFIEETGQSGTVGKANG